MKTISVIFFVIAVIWMQPAYAQSINGQNGYFYIPNGEIAADGTITFGSFYLNSNYTPYKSENAIWNYYVNLAFMPFLEVHVKFSNGIGTDDALGDRTLGFKIRITKEDNDGLLPGIAIGIVDLIHTLEQRSNKYASTFLAATKNIELNSIVNNISLTLGYGTEWLKGKYYQYIGLWGGAEVGIFNRVGIIAEYDGTHAHTAVRINIYKGFNLMAGFMENKYITFGVTINAGLR